MRGVTADMIKQYKLKKYGYDFMGYRFTNINQLSFHHLIVPKRNCKEMGLGDGYIQWNGAILRQDTAHDYLHMIERIDRPKFLAITDHLIKENKLGELSIEELRAIREILLEFEEEHKHDKNKQGKQLIKRQFIQGRIDL